MNRTPFDGAPGTTAGSFASYWNVVAFHVYVVPNTTAGGKIEAAMAPLDGTSAARRRPRGTVEESGDVLACDSSGVRALGCRAGAPGTDWNVPRTAAMGP